MQIDSSLGTTLPLTELGLLIEVACKQMIVAYRRWDLRVA